jgi:protein associated with RNAse G/E
MFKVSWFDAEDRQLNTAIVNQLEAVRSLALTFSGCDFYFDVSIEEKGQFKEFGRDELIQAFRDVGYPKVDYEALYEENVIKYWIKGSSLIDFVENNVETILKEYEDA